MIIGYTKGNLVKLMKQSVEHDDILQPKVFFTHGCNCHAAMGSGIAPQIAAAFPQVEEADRLYYNMMSRTHRHNDMLGEIMPVPLSKNVTLINSYTQFYPGRDFRIDALISAFSLINNMIAGHTLIIPRIGAGVAGGDWDLISNTIDRVTPDVKITVIDWDGTL